MLNIIKDFKCKVMVCGYDCMLYTKNLNNWKVTKKKIIKQNSVNKKQYSLWTNY